MTSNLSPPFAATSASTGLPHIYPYHDTCTHVMHAPWHSLCSVVQMSGSSSCCMPCYRWVLRLDNPSPPPRRHGTYTSLSHTWLALLIHATMDGNAAPAPSSRNLKMSTVQVMMTMTYDLPLHENCVGSSKSLDNTSPAFHKTSAQSELSIIPYIVIIIITHRIATHTPHFKRNSKHTYWCGTNLILKSLPSRCPASSSPSSHVHTLHNRRLVRIFFLVVSVWLSEYIYYILHLSKQRKSSDNEYCKNHRSR